MQSRQASHELRRAPTCERIWATYLVCVSAVALLTPGGGAVGHEPIRFVCIQAAVALAVVACALVARRRHEAARLPRAALAVIGLPTVFSSLCWILPGVHPEPYEFRWLALDRAVFGDDPGRVVAHLPAPVVELLQVDYAAFYVICIASGLLARRCSGAAAFDRAVVLLVGGFLVSYLGYLLVPTIAPKVVFADLPEPRGLWLTASLRAGIDGAEANHWDCFPSGHTMMTLTSLLILWRWARRWFWLLLLPGVLLVASTVLLGYHWCIDVAVGAALAWPVARGCDLLMDRDGWPRVSSAASARASSSAPPSAASAP